MLFFPKKTITFSLLFIINLTTNSQNTAFSLDSLSQKSYNELSDLFYESKPDTTKAITYANAYLIKALQKKDTMKIVRAKQLLADIKNNESIYLNYCDSIILITKRKPSKNYPAAIYYDKGRFLRSKEKLSKSLESLLLVHSKKIKNDSLQQITNVIIAAIKSTIGKKREAISIYKNIYKYAKKNDLLEYREFHVVLLNLSISYQHINQLDSALYYNQKAINLYQKINDSLSLGYTFYTNGGILYKKKEYQKSLNSYLKSVPFLIRDENYKVVTRTYSIVGRLYDSLNIPNKSLIYHLKADSLSIKTNIYSPSLRNSYRYLIKNFKKETNLEKHLLYINKLLELNKYYSKEKEKVNKTFTEEYDIPNLISEKKIIINELKNRVKKSKRNKLIYLSLLFITTLLILYQFKKRSIYKKRFLDLVNQRESIKHITIQNTKNTVTNKHNIPNNIVTSILKELDIFEKEEGFLNSDNSLQALANKVNTNTNYLSKVINHHKNTTFSNYINNLRINYTVERLKTDSLLRKYTIKAIANEVGFKNAESFSKAFYKFTEIKPSYFIKELEKTEINI
ncbi:helix-turn-helix domain-containing protein [Tenacibaculum ovolyticum]|uniref:helix-turn-helix domain-containing protein n=1 Tax=Tenacibaculum ovolyticum TaxID=104270 RepID=UPI000425726F|nr:helix-turn-helix domain-containing protein [Tenacibaculum ovolyticum]